VPPAASGALALVVLLDEKVHVFGHSINLNTGGAHRPLRAIGRFGSSVRRAYRAFGGFVGTVRGSFGPCGRRLRVLRGLVRNATRCGHSQNGQARRQRSQRAEKPISDGIEVLLALSTLSDAENPHTRGGARARRNGRFANRPYEDQREKRG